jgi:hypothetical protein
VKKVLVLLFLLFMPALAKAQSCDLNATTSNFTATLNGATSGQTICLAAGNYGAVPDISKKGVKIDGQNVATFSGGTWTAANPPAIANVTMTQPLCVRSTGFLLDHVVFGNLGQSCTEGRLGFSTGAANGTVSNSTFGPGGASDGIQFNGGANNIHIGPGNIFTGILQSNCGSVHCDSIQFYGASNITIDGNFFQNDSDAIMSPDCNGTPFTFSNNVVVGNVSQQLMIGGGRGDVFDHNTFSTANGGTIRFGNPNSCGLSANETVTNNILPNGLNLTEGQSTSSFTMSNNLSQAGTYVGGSNPTTWAGYALAPNSPGKGGGTGGTDIGINVSSNTSSAPAPPTNIQALVQ